MDLTTTGLAIITTISALSGIVGYFLMRSKFVRELAVSQKREEELTRRAYESVVLKEIGDRVGYSLSGAKIVEIISGSLGELLPYSTVSYLIVDDEEKVFFECNVRQSVSAIFVKEVKAKMLAAFSEITGKPLLESEVDEGVTGVILDEDSKESLRSFFNLPIVISSKLAGLINVGSTSANLYNDENTEVLYKIARLASDAVSRLQEVLENEKGRLSQAVGALADGLLMVNTSYRLLLVNPKLCQLLSIVSNPSLFDIVNALSGQLDLRTKMEEALGRDLPLPPLEIMVKDKVLQVIVSRVLDNKVAKPIAIVALFHDITDAKKLEKLRQDFTAMMVHELRSPLTSIKTTAEMLREELSKIEPGDLGRYLSTIDSTSQAMLELVGDLLDAAKLEAGKFDVICEAGDLPEVIAELVESFKLRAQEKDLGINVEVETDLPRAFFDKIRIKQVFANLLSNAIKYTEAGEITVKAVREIVDGRVIDILVSVTDTGVGIEEEAIGLLFSRFGQLEAGRKKGAGSSGLGLYITKGIVEASGGKIWAKSEGLGMGSIFYFTVPLADLDSKGTISSEFGAGVLTSKKVAQA